MPRARGVAPPASASQSDEPAWTPTSETLRFMQGLWALVHALEVRSKRMSRTMGVTGPQRLVLRVIGQRPDATAGDIARMLDLHASTFDIDERALGHGANLLASVALDALAALRH